MKSLPRSSKGSIATWLLLLAIIGLTLVLGAIALESLIRFVSLARVQNAVQEATLVYARDMVRLRDNRLSLIQAGQNINFQTAGLPTYCSSDATVSGGGNQGCTPLTGSKASIPGALNLENLNASQVFLYNVWGSRLNDASQINDVKQKQCYKQHAETRFSLNQNSPLSECDVAGKVTSPIMELKWYLEAAPYGYGACCSTDPNSTNDFCVKVTATGRMDPIMAGGLPFLKDIDFIKNGDFNISVRAAVKKMEFANNNTTGASNLSAETISLENVPKGLTCSMPPSTPFTPSCPNGKCNDPYTPPPDGNVDPPEEDYNEWVTPYTPPPPCSTSSPSCPAGTSANILSEAECSVTYQCNPCPTAGTVTSSQCNGNNLAITQANGNCGQTTQTQSCAGGCSNGACTPTETCAYKVNRSTNDTNYTHYGGLGFKDYLSSIYANRVSANSLNASTNIFNYNGNTSIDVPSFDNFLNTCPEFIKSLDPLGLEEESPFQIVTTSSGFYGERKLTPFSQCFAKINHISESKIMDAYNNVYLTEDPNQYSEDQSLIQTINNFATMTSNGLFLNDEKTSTSLIALYQKLNISFSGFLAYNFIIKQSQGKGYGDHGSYYFDLDGNLVNNPTGNICGILDVPSPISLILSDKVLKNEINHFSIEPYIKDKYFTWKASASRPLLVYDPEHKGVIKDGTQLFGNYSFGKEWKNGYEALASLDKNKDGKVSEVELKDLALWFDNNQDGISDKGEVKLLSKVGITALFFAPNSTNLENGDIHASVGYERVVNGKKVTGESVDWFAEGPFDTKEEALMGKQFVAGVGFIDTEKYFVGRH